MSGLGLIVSNFQTFEIESIFVLVLDSTCASSILGTTVPREKIEIELLQTFDWLCRHFVIHWITYYL